MKRNIVAQQTGCEVGSAGIGGACSTSRTINSEGKSTDTQSWGGVDQMLRAFPLQNPPKEKVAKKRY